MTGQAAFAAALTDPARSVPAGVTGPAGQAAGNRFDVYRNNVAVSLTEALIAGFPVVHALVGDDFFRAMAGVFWRAHPPRTPVLTAWGDDLPAFLAGFAPAARLPFLADVARLELAVRHACHAADTVPADPARLAALDAAALTKARLRLAPAVGLVRSAWPVATIWLAHRPGGPALPGAAAPAEDALVTRPGFDPIVTALPPGGGAFVAALIAGQSFGAAADAAGPGFDLAAALAPLLAGGAIAAILTESPAP
jgi:hypothetical protein